MSIQIAAPRARRRTLIFEIEKRVKVHHEAMQRLRGRDLDLEGRGEIQLRNINRHDVKWRWFESGHGTITS
eukprot:2503727-Pleurochrysis_carterae.AAC.2